MIVLDANILIRAVLGKRVRQLLEIYAPHGIRFYAPEVAYADAEKYEVVTKLNSEMLEEGRNTRANTSHVRNCA